MENQKELKWKMLAEWGLIAFRGLLLLAEVIFHSGSRPS